MWSARQGGCWFINFEAEKAFAKAFASGGSSRIIEGEAVR